VEAQIVIKEAGKIYVGTKKLEPEDTKTELKKIAK